MKNFFDILSFHLHEAAANWRYRLKQRKASRDIDAQLTRCGFVETSRGIWEKWS